MSEDGFFLQGDAPNRGYRNVRDRTSGPAAKGHAFIEELWPRYRGLEDRHFREDAKAHFLERFWEMYLAVTFIERGLAPVRRAGVGPEFCFHHGGTEFLVEAVAPGPGSGGDRVEEPEDGVATRVPTEQILLRFTNVISEKRRKYLAAVAAGVCREDAGYILAINSRGIPHAAYGNTLPFFLQALLPIGAPTLLLDRTTGTTVDSYYAHRDSVAKSNGSAVSTAGLLSPDYSFVSAVINSAVDCVNRPAGLGEDFTLLHNPNAAYPLDRSLFTWCRQYVWNDFRLEMITG